MKEDGEYVIPEREKDSSDKITKWTMSWCSVEQKHHMLIVSVDENTTGKERKLEIGIQAGNFFTSMKVIQSAK